MTAWRFINRETPIREWVTIVLDEVGVGAGVLDRLLEQEVDVVGFNGGQSSVNKRFTSRHFR